MDRRMFAGRWLVYAFVCVIAVSGILGHGLRMAAKGGDAPQAYRIASGGVDTGNS